MPGTEPSLHPRRDGQRRARPRTSDALKRAFDVVAAILGGALLSPVLLAVTLIVWKDAGRPILFRQVRAGRAGVPFTILKFRTMDMRDAYCCLDPRDCIGVQMPVGTRMSRRVEMLRRTGLDELPQLINILRGEMSVIGPRPLLVRYVPRYTGEQARRLEVRPGITGWAQVNGRTDISWEEKLALDVWYVDHRSVPLDVRILIQTVKATRSGSGYSQSGSETGTEFLGSGVAPGICPATELPMEEAAKLGQPST